MKEKEAVEQFNNFNLDKELARIQGISSQSQDYIKCNKTGKAIIAYYNLAMDTLVSLFLDIDQENKNQQTIGLLFVRVYSDSIAALDNALRGFYHASLATQRMLIETGLLLEYLDLHPDKIADWGESSESNKVNYAPHVLYKALDSRPEGVRKKIYRFSSKVSHPTVASVRQYYSFQEKRHIPGAFFDERSLAGALSDLNDRLFICVVAFSTHIKGAKESTVSLCKNVMQEYGSIKGQDFTTMASDFYASIISGKDYQSR